MEKMKYRIYYVWVGDKAMPDNCKKYLDTWSKIKDADIIQIGNECEEISLQSPFLRKAFHEENWCNVSNYMRAYAMYNWGGVYMDTDVEVVRDSDVWTSMEVNFAQEMECWLNSHLMIAHNPGHIIFKHMIDKMDSFDYPADTYIEIETGPRLITRAMQWYGYEMKDIDKPVKHKDIIIHPEVVFSPHRWNKKYNPKEVKNETLAVHHFTKLW